MRTVGLDIASCTGMALCGDGEDRGKTIHLPKYKKFERLQYVAAEVARTLVIWKPDLVAIEGYAYCRNISSFIVLVELGTVIRAVLYEQKLPWVVIPPTVLKKWVTGDGHASKEQMALSVRTRWNYTSFSHDVVDAFALAAMAHDLGSERICAIKGVDFG